jgi:transposase
MTQVRRQHSKQVKFRAAMDMVKGEKTIQQISQTYAVHQSVLMRWKKTLTEEGPRLFEDQRKKTPSEDQTAELQRKVGQLTMEIDFLKKALGQ